MKKLLLPLLLPTVMLTAVLGLLAAQPQPAAAQSCQYTATFTFDSDEEGWLLDSVEWNGAAGHNAAGQLHGDTSLPGDNPYAVEATMPVSYLMQLWSLPLTTTVTGPGATIVGYARYMTPGGAYAAYIGAIAYDGLNGGYILSSPVNTSTWAYASKTIPTNYQVDVFLLYANLGPDDSYWDDVTITVDCTAMSPNPDPNPVTPTPTSTPLAGLVTPIPTPTSPLTISVTGVGGTQTFTYELPGPIEIPEYTGPTLSLEWLWDWDLFSNWISIVRTVPVLLQRYSFTSVLAALGAILIAIRAFASARERQQVQANQKGEEV